MSKARDRSRRHWRRRHAAIIGLGPLERWQRPILYAALQGHMPTPYSHRAYLSPRHAATSKGGDPK